ncbi:MAG: alpha/beta fold hydrolase [Maritimibacter sp.]|nr:alpha/beta fold hydrolase [Maritimibacter sp.]
MTQADLGTAIVLKDIHSFHVGGSPVELTGQPLQEMRVSGSGAPRMVDLNGTYVAGQLYAQHYQLVAPRTPQPVLFWHGGAMTGVTWETTPDGRPGWQQVFLRAGHDVVISDSVERGRSSWAPYPSIYAAPPIFRTKEDAWTLFRMGPASGFAPDARDRRAFPGQRFPVAAFDQLCAQFVPRWTNNDEPILAAYERLLEHLGPATVVAHSQGAWFALNMAIRRPDLIRAIVAIEPAGAPDPTADAARRAANVPIVAIWGDYCDALPAWTKYKSQVTGFLHQVEAAGGQVDVFDLPQMGIHGNSHMPMMDDNSAEIAALVLTWIADIEAEQEDSTQSSGDKSAAGATG